MCFHVDMETIYRLNQRDKRVCIVPARVSVEKTESLLLSSVVVESVEYCVINLARRLFEVGGLVTTIVATDSLVVNKLGLD